MDLGWCMLYLSIKSYCVLFDSTDSIDIDSTDSTDSADALLWRKRSDYCGTDSFFVVHKPTNLTCLYARDINRYSIFATYRFTDLP